MQEQKKTSFEMQVINQIIAIRKEKGLSQNDIANLLDITRGFIGQVESPNNSSTYSLNQLNKLAYKLECSLHDIIPEKPICEKNWK